MEANDLKFVNVRLSYPALFTAKKAPGSQTAKFGCTIILDKRTDAAQIQSIKQLAAKIAQDKWQGKAKGIKLCLRDGVEKEGTEGYGPDVMFFNTSSTVRPVVVDRQRNPLVETDGKCYPGCRVNVVVRLWAQDNEFGKRVNAEIKAVQWWGDDTPLGGATPVDANEVFEAAGDAPAVDDDNLFE